MHRRSTRAAPRAAFVAALLAATVVAGSACDGSPLPPPVTTTTGPTTPAPTTSAPATVAHRQCVAEAAFLTGVGNVLVRIATTYTTDSSTGAREQDVADAQHQLTLLQARPPREPYAGDRRALIAAATDIIDGIQGLLGRGNHKSDRANMRLVTAGGSGAVTALSTVRDHRSTCPP